MTKNIAIAYSVFLCFSSSAIALIPIGVVAPLIPKAFAEMFNEIKPFALSGTFPNRKLLRGDNSLANLLDSFVFSKRLKTPIQTACTIIILVAKESAFSPPVKKAVNTPSGLINSKIIIEIEQTSAKITFIGKLYAEYLLNMRKKCGKIYKYKLKEVTGIER